MKINRSPGLAAILAPLAIVVSFAVTKIPAAIDPGRAGDASLARAFRGRTLFLKNCAHCHGDDARGDEGPSLYGVERPDSSIATLILKGKKGEMPGFEQKLGTNEVALLVAYIRKLDP
jgi:mono/diheme cytochrome c family protein